MSRSCSDCYHCDIDRRWCKQYNCAVPTTLVHPDDRDCPHFEDYFDRADREFVLRQIELLDEYGHSKHYAKEPLDRLEKQEPVKPKKKVRTVKDVWK